MYDWNWPTIFGLWRHTRTPKTPFFSSTTRPRRRPCWRCHTLRDSTYLNAKNARSLVAASILGGVLVCVFVVSKTTRTNCTNAIQYFAHPCRSDLSFEQLFLWEGGCATLWFQASSGGTLSRISKAYEILLVWDTSRFPYKSSSTYLPAVLRCRTLLSKRIM